jgi:hypothetical protein
MKRKRPKLAERVAYHEAKLAEEREQAAKEAGSTDS